MGVGDVEKVETDGREVVETALPKWGSGELELEMLTPVDEVEEDRFTIAEQDTTDDDEL